MWYGVVCVCVCVCVCVLGVVCGVCVIVSDPGTRSSHVLSKLGRPGRFYDVMMMCGRVCLPTHVCKPTMHHTRRTYMHWQVGKRGLLECIPNCIHMSSLHHKNRLGLSYVHSKTWEGVGTRL